MDAFRGLWIALKSVKFSFGGTKAPPLKQFSENAVGNRMFYANAGFDCPRTLDDRRYLH